MGSWVAQDQAIATLSHSSLDHFMPRPIVNVLCVFGTEHVPVQTDSLAWPAFN